MKIKRILSLLVSMLMLLSMMPNVVAAEPIKIASAADFPREIAEGTVYELSSDIALSSGQQIEKLAGVLDGKGYTVTLSNKPLANEVSGTIQNLGVLSGETPLSLSNYQGTVAVNLSGTIQNSYSLVDMNASGYDEIGGLVGTLDGGKIYNSYYAGTTSGMFSYGFAAYVTGGEVANSCCSKFGFDSFGTGGTKVIKTNLSRTENMTGIDVVNILNTDINSTGFKWEQDSQNQNGGYPVFIEDTGEVTVNKTVLEARIAEAKEFKEEKYTVSTWDTLKTALERAEATFNSETATQSDVNSVLSALESAIKGLERIKPTEPVSISDYSDDKIKHLTKQSELEAIGAGNTDMYYILDNDISLDNWYMSHDAFNGVFDGNGHTVTFNGSYTGLFKNIGNNGVVQNVHFTGALKESVQYGACGQEIQGLVINCYTEVTGANASGFARRLNGGIISNCYSVSKAEKGAIIEQTETQNGVSYTGTLKNVYWENSLIQSVDLSKLTLAGDVKALKASAMKSMDFVNTLNANKGAYGTSWGQNSTGYPYFGENLSYTPEEEGKVELFENKTPIAFIPERTQVETIIENQELKIEPKSAINKIAGLFTLPEYELKDGERIEWSAEQQSVEGVATIGSLYPYLSIEKEGVLVVKATLVKEDSSTEALACTKVIISANKIEDIKLYLAEYGDMQNGTEIVDGKATVSGSADMRLLIKVLYSGELEYQAVSSESFKITLSDPNGIVKHTENTTTFRFIKPGMATMTVTYNDDDTMTESVELTSSYVPVTSVVPGISGQIEIHGRNGNSSNISNFLPNYANVSVEPANASYAPSYTITSSDTTVGEYVTSMVHGYVPHKAGKVTYTASIDDNGRSVSGSTDVTYVYKNPLKSVTVEKDKISLNVGKNVSAGLVFEGTLTDGHEITETGMNWSFSEDGIISISRGDGFWKRDEDAPDKGNYFLSSEYTIKALAEGIVTVTGIPVDTTSGAKPVTFTVTVGNDGTEAPDVYDIISKGIGTSETYLKKQLEELHNGEGVSYGFEWYVVAMLRAGKTIDEGILEEYYESVADAIKTWTSEVKPTDAERVAIALTVMGKDITNIDGVNLAEIIYNSDKLTDGSNELAYALLALDASETEIPETAKWNRGKIISELLKFQTSNGGFGLKNNNSSDIDVTAMCIQALAPYCNDAEVKESVTNALKYLKESISSDYKYANANTTAQVLWALAELGIDITKSENGFGGEYYNIITALDGYRNTSDDGFMYDDNVNPMTTVQVMQAYDAYRKAHKENLSYWDFAVEGAKYDDVSNSGDDEDDKEEQETVTVYVTIADDGKIVTDKNGGYMAQAPVKVIDVDDNGTLTYDEALYCAHETYYQGGAEVGYSSYMGAYGVSLAILWGKGEENVSANAGYYLNNASCWSLEDEVKNGDYLTAFNYKDTEYWSDSYSYFTENTVETEKGESVVLTLNATGYDENYNTVVTPYSGANVVFIGENNGTQKIFTTDEEGKVKISFTDASAVGSYYVMAYMEDGTIVPAVCKISVTEDNDESSGGSASKNISVYIKVADPEGSTYLKKKSYSVKKGTSVYELLQKTGLDIEVVKSAYGIYVKGIEGLAEFDEGPNSGWMYRVNGKFSNYSASLYSLSNGDYVEWLYTRDLGEDIGESSSNSSVSGIYNPNNKSNKNETTKNNTNQELTSSFGENTFTDVKKDDWFYDSVKYTYDNNLMQGTGNGFEPERNMSRAMLVTVLYRLEKAQSAGEESKFTDVPGGQWYTDAVIWAEENGIVTGVSETEFAPDENITREQMSVIIYRYGKMKDYVLNDFADLSVFTDADEISDWAFDAIRWANKKELINGTSETTLSPKENATRAQVSAILMRFCENVVR